MEAGADHDTTSECSRPSTEVISGAPGTCAGNGANGFELELHALRPAILTALTRATYAAPTQRPPTSAALLELDTDTVTVEHPLGSFVPGAAMA